MWRAYWQFFIGDPTLVLTVASGIILSVLGGTKLYLENRKLYLEVRKLQLESDRLMQDKKADLVTPSPLDVRRFGSGTLVLLAGLLVLATAGGAYWGRVREQAATGMRRSNFLAFPADPREMEFVHCVYDRQFARETFETAREACRPVLHGLPASPAIPPIQIWPAPKPTEPHRK